MLKRTLQLSAFLMIVFVLNPVKANPAFTEFDRCTDNCPGNPGSERAECCIRCGKQTLKDPNTQGEQIQKCIKNSQ